MITVNYLDGVDNIRCDEHLFQWDNGQKLCLSGLNTYVSNLETVDVHFCNKISKLAITVKPTVVSNNIVAPIPNSLLQDPYPIIAYFYVPSDNGSRTIVMVTIPIEPKKRPSDFILNEDEAIASLDAINNKVNTTLNNITVDYNNFKTNIEAELRDIVENLQLEDAKTLSSKSIDYFMHWRNETIVNPDTCEAIGIYQWFYPTTITDYPATYGTLIVSNANGYKSQVLIGVDATVYIRHKTYDQEWSAWRNVSDGGNADTLDNLHASSFALKTDIPTSLPANGGNADTLSSKSIDYFMHWRNETIVNPDTCEAIGIYQWFYPTTITDYPATYGTLIVSNANGYKSQVLIGVDATVYIRHKTYDQEWSAWRNVSDGGNADTANYATTAGDAGTVNGVKLLVGTREPQIEEPNALAYVPENAWYGQYT